MLADWTTDSLCSYHGTSLNFRLGLSHNGCVLFEPTDFSLVRGYVTALVGTNGSGKTSLAKVIASKELPGFPKDFTIHYVSSHESYILSVDDDMNVTPNAYLHRAVDDKLSSLRQNIEELEEVLGKDPSSIESISNLLSEKYDLVDEMQVSCAETINKTLTDLGFDKYKHKKLCQLSSGWRYKCRLAAAFIVQPDLLIVDEPSFLDTASTEWFIDRVKAAQASNAIVLLISHKEDLLETLCNRVWYINSANLTISSYNCGYETFRTSHMSEVSLAEKTCAEYEQQTQNATQSLKRIQTQLHKREQNFKKITTAHADQRFIKGKNKESKQKADRSAAAKLKQLKQQSSEMEELRRQALCEQVKPLSIPGVISDRPIVQFTDVSFSYDAMRDDSEVADTNEKNYVFQHITACVDAQDRIFLCGSNGCGKSTLLRLVLGELEPSQGTILRREQVLYFPQTALSDLVLNHNSICPANYLGAGESFTETDIRTHLGHYGLGGDVAYRPIQCLSAGQRVRLCLAKALLNKPPPCALIMDEISENLDVETRQSLSNVLNTFVGAVIAVSHDVNFCHLYQPTQIWHLSDKGLRIEHVE